MPVKIVQNTALPSMGALQPLEPSVATTGDDSFYTAWRVFYLSSDSGNSFAQPSHGAAGIK